MQVAMNAVTGFAKGLSRFASPAYYAGEYAKVVKSVSADFSAGSVRPLFQGMLLVGVVGYTMEYIAIGRTFPPPPFLSHVAHRH